MTKGRTASTFASPVSEAYRWLEGMEFAPEHPLLNVSQAAPTDPPPLALRQYISEFALNDPMAHFYGPVLGSPALREQIARQWSTDYDGRIDAENIAITSGCNQAFAAAITTLCDQGDEVILPCPWYFNHKMWLDMSGVAARPLMMGDDLLPDPAAAASLITPRTRAIVLVTPNNPTGVEYPSELVRAFYELAQRHGIALIIDETYRDFDSRRGPPHGLFARPDWDQTLIQLYSFSKAFRLTGHRVGSIAASPARLAEVEKFLDTVTICPSQIGQAAALWGMQNLAVWVAAERRDILRRKAAVIAGFERLIPLGWRLKGCGAYFAYLEHPFASGSDEIAHALLDQCAILMLPGTFFAPTGDELGQRHLRLAFANIDETGISQLYERLETFAAT